MKTLITLFVLLTAGALSSPQARAGWFDDRIINTTYNSHGPMGKMIEIKNIDLHHQEFGNQGFSGNSYKLSIYLWVNQDLGNLTNAIHVVDANHPGLKADSSFGAEARKVGYDEHTGYAVYEVQMNLGELTSPLNSAFYAEVGVNGEIQHSNEGNPNQYFLFTTN